MARPLVLLPCPTSPLPSATKDMQTTAPARSPSLSSFQPRAPSGSRSSSHHQCNKNTGERRRSCSPSPFSSSLSLFYVPFPTSPSNTQNGGTEEEKRKKKKRKPHKILNQKNCAPPLPLLLLLPSPPLLLSPFLRVLPPPRPLSHCVPPTYVACRCQPPPPSLALLPSS